MVISYGEAFRTTMQVAPRPKLDENTEWRLERGIKDLGRLLLAKLGGIVVSAHSPGPWSQHSSGGTAPGSQG